MKLFLKTAGAVFLGVCFLAIMVTCVGLMLDEGADPEGIHHWWKFYICGPVLFMQIVFFVWSRLTWLK